jgi:formyl-CoA transferase
MALRHKEVNGGKGQVVDVALYEAVFAMMESLVPEFDVFGFIRERTGNVMPGITPSNTHTTKDGKHLIVGANGDAIFRRCMEVMNRLDLASDPQLQTNAGRDTRAVELYGVIDAWVAQHDEAFVLKTLGEAGVPASRIYSIQDMFGDPQFLAREMLKTAQLPDGKEFRMPGIVPRLTETPGGVDSVGPALGAHTDVILSKLGYSSAQIVDLREKGAV